MNSTTRGRVLRPAGALCFCLLFTVGIHSVRSHNQSAPDYACITSKNGLVEEAIVHISAGATGFEIGQTLEAAEVVKSAEAYFRVAVGNIRSNKVAPGDHRLSTNNCARDVLVQLLDSKRISGLISVTEGMWISEILPQMYVAGFSKADVGRAIATLKKPGGFNNLEGLLFPAQYSFDRDTSAQKALESMVDRAATEMKRAGFFLPGARLTPQKLLIISSLIQAEGSETDFGKISRVIYNRLNKGMPLQFDSTVHYVKKLRGTIFLSTQSTLINSEYNTYRRYGLPPGPINNPGFSAMQAALNPEPGNWLYFITVSPGDTRFTDNLAEFGTWKIEYKKNLRAGKFRSKQ